MGTTLKKMIDNVTITSEGIEDDLNYFYIMRPNEATAVEKESKITLEEIYRLLDSDNAYYNSGWFYKAIGVASLYENTSGIHAFSSAVSGAADAAITFVETMRTGLSSNSEKVLSVGKETFEAWDSGAVLQLGGNGFLYNDETDFIWGYNAYYDGAWKYTDTDEASRLYQKNDGSLVFEGAVSGTANDPITWVDAFSVSPEGDTVVNGTFNMLSHETISANTTITLEKTDKLRTIVVNGTLTQLTINKGTGADESSVARIINNTAVGVVITDGSNPFTLLPNEEGDFYFNGSVINRVDFENFVVDTTSTITPKKGMKFITIVTTNTALTITMDLSNLGYNVTIKVTNFTVSENTFIDSSGINSFKIKSGFTSLFFVTTSGANFKLSKLTPSISYNTGITDPRDEFRGFIHADGVTENTVFDSLSPFIPNIGDTINLGGAMKKLSGIIVALVSTSYAIRNSATKIDIRGLRDDSTANGFSVNDGGTDPFNASISW